MYDLIAPITICFIAMISPGPDFVLVSRNALRLPKGQALATALGIVAGCLFHATYCIAGLAVLITKSVVVFSFIRYLGAAYLIYLGLRGLFFSSSSIAIHEKAQRATTQLSIKLAFFEGFLCNLLNPKAAMFLLSLFTQFIAVDASFFERMSIAAIFVIESAIYWPLLVLALQSQVARDFFLRFQQGIERVCCVVLVGLGIRVALARE